MYLQWCAAEQLAEVARAAARAGVRLYRDLAVGVDQNAADVWAGGETYVRGVTVGAPPDALNPYGQDWGLPPLDPGTLARNGYADLLALLEANCAEAGALRIDHAFSLARLYWIPRGADARSGTYVTYPFDDLRGIVALASARKRCTIVGEDLGTVPGGFRERMQESGILSYRILFFERASAGRFLRPDEYPALALAATGTHDLATIPAWLNGDDIELRATLNLLHGSLEDERAARARDKRLFLEALTAHANLAPADYDDPTAVVIAANRYLALTPSAITMAQLDDILGERTPVNVPGTASEYPNWRRRLAVSMESLGTHPGFNELCRTLRTERPRSNVQ
jgi:4-alpha-glucanotransferase